MKLTLANMQKFAKVTKLTEKCKTPFYLLNREELKKSVERFLTAFQKSIPDFKAFYAIKANHHPAILQEVLRHDFGLDVSSGHELVIALEQGAQNIIFSGAGKSDDELDLAVRNNQKVIINIDSFFELEKLGRIAQKYKKRVSAGVRFFTSHHGQWDKFGIPLSDMKKFWKLAQKYKFIDLKGLQFHMSHNKNPKVYRNVILELALHLKKNFTKKMLASIQFIDFGGGIFADKLEGHYVKDSKRHFLISSKPVEEFAENISQAIKKYLNPLVQCAYYAEPGRIICSTAMDIVLRIVDKKRKDGYVADGGTNMVGWGWGFGEKVYYPIINITHPSSTEIAARIDGSLCTPKDVWGYYCYAKKIEKNDILLIPNQGAYTYSLAQSFIKAIPPVYEYQADFSEPGRQHQNPKAEGHFSLYSDHYQKITLR